MSAGELVLDRHAPACPVAVVDRGLGSQGVAHRAEDGPQVREVVLDAFSGAGCLEMLAEGLQEGLDRRGGSQFELATIAPCRCTKS